MNTQQKSIYTTTIPEEKQQPPRPAPNKHKQLKHSQLKTCVKTYKITQTVKIKKNNYIQF